jgi:hypothetical protein
VNASRVGAFHLLQNLKLALELKWKSFARRTFKAPIKVPPHKGTALNINSQFAEFYFFYQEERKSSNIYFFTPKTIFTLHM